LEGRVIAHLHDDATGAPHMILEGTDARVHFICHSSAMQEMRQHGLLKPNAFVVFLRTGNGQADRLLKIQDLGDADSFLQLADTRTSARRLVRSGIVNVESESNGGWRGRGQRLVAKLHETAQSLPGDSAQILTRAQKPKER
jgi:hypothetical protein